MRIRGSTYGFRPLVSVRLCSIGKTRCSLATIKGRRTGRPSPHLSRPANCMVSIRKPTSPTCSQSSSISGLHRASTSSCLGVGQHSVPPIASRRNDEGDSRSRSIQRKNQAIGTVGSENRLRSSTSRFRRIRLPIIWAHSARTATCAIFQRATYDRASAHVSDLKIKLSPLSQK